MEPHEFKDHHGNISHINQNISYDRPAVSHSYEGSILSDQQSGQQSGQIAGYSSIQQHMSDNAIPEMSRVQQPIAGSISDYMTMHRLVETVPLPPSSLSTSIDLSRSYSDQAGHFYASNIPVGMQLAQNLVPVANADGTSRHTNMVSNYSTVYEVQNIYPGPAGDASSTMYSQLPGMPLVNVSRPISSHTVSSQDPIDYTQSGVRPASHVTFVSTVNSGTSNLSAVALPSEHSSRQQDYHQIEDHDVSIGVSRKESETSAEEPLRLVIHGSHESGFMVDKQSESYTESKNGIDSLDRNISENSVVDADNRCDSNGYYNAQSEVLEILAAASDKEPNALAMINIDEDTSLQTRNPQLAVYANDIIINVTYKCKTCNFTTVKPQKYIDHYQDTKRHPNKTNGNDNAGKTKHRPKRKWAIEHEKATEKLNKVEWKKPLKKRRGFHLQKEASLRSKRFRQDKHTEEIKPQKKLACKLCLLEFVSELELKIHSQCHLDSNSDRQGCYLCDFQIAADVIADSNVENKMAATWELLRKHISAEHPEKLGKYECNNCISSFSTKYHLNAHCMNQIPCKTCQKKFCSSEVQKKHEKDCKDIFVENQNEDGSEIPNDNGYANVNAGDPLTWFATKDNDDDDTDYDEEVNDDDDDYVTYKKERKRKRGHRVKAHRRRDLEWKRSTKVKNVMYSCSLEGCNSKMTNPQEMEVHKLCHKAGTPGLVCYVCNFVPHRKVVWSVMKRHFVSVHPGLLQAKFLCDLCQKGFSSLSQLNDHKFAHTTERQQICEECGASFKRMNHLTKHIDVVHKGVKYERKKYEGPKTKDHMCEICGFATTTKKQLQAHINAHLNVRPHKCPECDFHASDPSTVRKHRRKHLAVKKFKCDHCDYRCNFKQNLRQHVASSHKELCPPTNVSTTTSRTTISDLLASPAPMNSLPPSLALQQNTAPIPQSSIIDQASKIAELNQLTPVQVPVNEFPQMYEMWHKSQQYQFTNLTPYLPPQPTNMQPAFPTVSNANH